MLQSINDKAKGILGWIIIAFISVPFALWGIQEYIGGAPERFAAKVDDTEISIRDFDQALIQYKQRLESSLQGQLPTGEAFDKRIKEQVLDQLVTQRVLEIMVQNSGYRISNASLAKNIQSMEAFQRDGKFVPGSYKEIVNSQGMSVAEFEYLFRRDLAVQQLQNGVTRSTIVGNSSLQLIDRLQQQTRDVSYLLYEQARYNPEISLTDDEIQQYFSENQNRYMHPEQASVSYVELKASDLGIDVAVDEEALRRQYDEYLASLADNEQRKARHILIQLSDSADAATQAEKKARADDLLNKLQAGESFENLAKSFSDDPGSAKQGGDLGWVSKGMMVPVFENALFALKKGEISAVVKSGFGYHIIKMDDLKAATPESYETRKAELIKDQQKHAIDNQFYERSELMATLAYENDETLQPVADALNIKIKHTPLFTRFNGQGVATNDAVRKAAFDSTVLKEGRNSEVIELGENHILVLRVDEHKPSKAKMLDEVKAQVTAALTASKAREKAQAAGLQALVELQQGKPIEELAQDSHAELVKLGSIRRDQKDADQSVVQSAFQMQKPGPNKPSFKTIDMSKGVAVIALNSVDEKANASEPAVMAVIGKQVESSLSNQEMTAALEYLKSQAEIIRANDLF